MKIAIAGSGALGSGFGYMLAKGGNNVTLMDYWDEHIQAVQENGLTIDVNGETDNIEIPWVNQKILMKLLMSFLFLQKQWAYEECLKQ